MGFFVLKKSTFYTLKLHLPVCLKGGLSKIKIFSTYFIIKHYYSTLCTLKEYLL